MNITKNSISKLNLKQLRATCKALHIKSGGTSDIIRNRLIEYTNMCDDNMTDITNMIASLSLKRKADDIDLLLFDVKKMKIDNDIDNETFVDTTIKAKLVVHLSRIISSKIIVNFIDNKTVLIDNIDNIINDIDDYYIDNLSTTLINNYIKIVADCLQEPLRNPHNSSILSVAYIQNTLNNMIECAEIKMKMFDDSDIM